MPPPRRTRPTISALTAIALGLTLASCSDDAEPTADDTSQEATTPAATTPADSDTAAASSEAAPAGDASQTSAPADDLAASLTAVPTVAGPITEPEGSRPWSTTELAREPFDVADRGYVEEEFFVSGTANVYDNTGGELTVTTADVAYVNHILVRRPLEDVDASGVVLVDILNASNGFPGEDHWRRTWDWAMEEGHTVIGVTSKPIQVDALQNYDPERYADLSWDVAETDREPLVADPEDPASFRPFAVIEGAEEGLAWDILTQVGTLLRDDTTTVLGGQEPSTILLLGQSQSGVYLNTYATNFHEVVTEANGAPVFDGYLNSVGAVVERPLVQSDEGGFVTEAGSEPALDVPFITVTAEGDAGLFGAATLAEKDLPENRRH